jgi:glycosyltransferase involved in cell wall biosynthesis
MATADHRPNLAILPWGYVFEEFLDPLGITMEQFRTTVSGGWLFNYVRALGGVGIESTIVLVSRDARRTTWTAHEPTGARLCVLPAPIWLRAALRGRPTRTGRTRRRSGRAGAHDAAPTTGQEAVTGTDVAAAIDRDEGGRNGALLLETMRDVARYGAMPVLPLTRALRRAGCTGILCQEYEYARFDVCVTVGRLMGIPVFGTFQGGTPGEGVLQPLLRPRAIRRSAGLIIGAAGEADRVREMYGIANEMIGRIHNPIALDEIEHADRDAVRASLGIEQDARVAVWHGRVSMHTKGLDVLVDAWRRIAGERPHARLLLVGSGGDDGVLRALVAPELEAGTIRWIDRYIPEKAEVYRLLYAGDVHVFPSRHEGFPVAPLEAMACGLPVVAAQASGVAEILGGAGGSDNGCSAGGSADSGVQVPTGDAAALAAALAALLDDPDRTLRMGAAARRRAEQHFSVPAIGARLGEWLAGRGFPRGRVRT